MASVEAHVYAFPPEARCTAFQANGSGGTLQHVTPLGKERGWRLKWCRHITVICFNQSNAMAIKCEFVSISSFEFSDSQRDIYCCVFYCVMALCSNWIMDHFGLAQFFWALGVMWGKGAIGTTKVSWIDGAGQLKQNIHSINDLILKSYGVQ